MPAMQILTQIMPQQTNPTKLQEARGNLLHGLPIQVQPRYGCHLLLPGRRLPRSGGQIQDGKSGECSRLYFLFFLFVFFLDFGNRQKRFP